MFNLLVTMHCIKTKNVACSKVKQQRMGRGKKINFGGCSTLKTTSRTRLQKVFCATAKLTQIRLTQFTPV